MITAGCPEQGKVLAQRYELVSGRDWKPGVVWRAIDQRALVFARDPYLSLIVAPDLLRQERDSLTKVLDLARSWQRISHESIAEVFALQRDGDWLFLTLETLTEPLFETADTAPAAEKLNIITTLGAALARAHAGAQVHGRLGRSSLARDKDGRVKLLDPGTGSFLAAIGSIVPREAKGPGAAIALYASPEVLQGQRYDSRADVYSLACLAYELLTGVHPFQWLSSVTACAENRRVKRLPALSRTQFAALQQALAFNAAERTPTVECFLNDISRARPEGRLALATAALLGFGVLTQAFIASSPETPSAQQEGMPSGITPETEGAQAWVPTQTEEALNVAPIDVSQQPLSPIKNEPEQPPVEPGPLPPAEPHNVANPNDQRAIAALLSQAREQMAAEQWLGQGDNAVDTYRSVLRLAPGNEEAQQGLQRIAAALLQRAHTATRTEQWDSARAYLHAAQDVEPGDQQIAEALEQLMVAQESAEREAWTSADQAP